MASFEGFTLNGWQRGALFLAGVVLGLIQVARLAVFHGMSDIDGIWTVSFLAAVGMIVAGLSGVGRGGPAPQATRSRTVIAVVGSGLVLLLVVMTALLASARSDYDSLSNNYGIEARARARAERNLAACLSPENLDKAVNEELARRIGSQATQEGRNENDSNKKPK